MFSFKELRYFVYSLTLLSMPLYWSMMSLMGRDINANDSAGSGYVVYNVALFAVTILFSFNDIKLSKLNKGSLFLFGVIILYVFFFIVESLLSDATQTEWFSKSFNFFILFSVAGAIIGVIVSQNGPSNFYKYLDFISFLIGIGYLRSIPMMLIASEMLGGYQDIAYYSALSFGFILYGLIANRNDRFFIFKYGIMRFLTVVVGALLVVCVLSSGGRGGLVLLVAELAFSLTILFKRSSKLKSLIVIAIFMIAGMFASNYIMRSSVGDIVSIGMERGLSYFNSGKVDMSETSNRDIVYKEHIQRIKENPFIGEGIYTVLGKYEWPHNFFLELLATGGVMFLMFWLIVLVNCYRYLKIMIKQDKNNQYFVPLILYPSIMLLFSSSYIETRLFWFAIAVLLSEGHKITRQIKLVQSYR